MELLSVVVSCFGGEDLMDDFLSTLHETLKNHNHEVIIVSSKTLDYENSVVTTKKDALFDGLKKASGDIACFIDVNLIDKVRFLNPMIGLIDVVDRDFDVAITRNVKGYMFHNLMRNASQREFLEREFCLIKREAVDAILLENTFSCEFLKREGFRIAWYEY